MGGGKKWGSGGVGGDCLKVVKRARDSPKSLKTKTMSRAAELFKTHTQKRKKKGDPDQRSQKFVFRAPTEVKNRPNVKGGVKGRKSGNFLRVPTKPSYPRPGEVLKC